MHPLARLGAAIALSGAASAVHAAGSLAISQVYGGNGGSYNVDYVELFNRGTAPVSLNGLSLQYASASGTGNFAGNGVTALPAVTLQPGRYFLVQFGTPGAIGASLPVPDLLGSTLLSATSGKVVLVNALAGLACNGGSVPCDSAQLAQILDLVGYGTANFFEGAAAAPALDGLTAALRAGNGCEDTDSNAADFTAASPAPRNSVATLAPCDGAYVPTAYIHDIQGAAHVSPLAGQAVSFVPGIVTAVTGDGFWFQDPNPDSDPRTSEGLFVYTSTVGLKPAVGDSVKVSGTVTEFRPGGSTSSNLSFTELTSASVVSLGSGNPLPPAVVLGRGGLAIPTTVIEDDATYDVETSGVFDPGSDGLDFFESLEGMRVQINDPVVIGPTNVLFGIGELPVLADLGADAGLRSARGGIVVQAGDFNPERLALFGGLAPTPVANVGDLLSPVLAIVDYGSGVYRFLVTGTPGVTPLASAPETTQLTGDNRRLSVASYNFGNLASQDKTRLPVLAGQIVNAMHSPDIVGVMEIQDNTGPTDDGVVDASQTWGALIAAIVDAGGPTYSYRQIDPVNDQDGGQPGGNIRVGFLFAQNRVAFVDRPGGTATAATAAVAGSPGVQLSYSPGRIDPTSTTWNTSRKPLAGEFLFNGRRVIVIANHFNSTAGDDPLYGRFQPPVRASELQRAAQAQAVNAFVGSLQTLDPNAAIVVLGTLNDYPFSGTLDVLRSGGRLVNLADGLAPAERYNYLYLDGNSVMIDHILVSPALATYAAPALDVVHVNAEYATRASDHDPLVATLTVPLAGDVDGDGDIDRNDVALIVAARNTSTGNPFDPRDLNRDGRIDVLDARLAAIRCTRSGCATN
jgi:predicted extracellular nuclease